MRGGDLQTLQQIAYHMFDGPFRFARFWPSRAPEEGGVFFVEGNGKAVSRGAARHPCTQGEVANESVHRQNESTIVLTAIFVPGEQKGTLFEKDFLRLIA